VRYKYIPASLAALLLGAFILFLLITCGLPGRGSGPVETGEGPFPKLRPGRLLEPPLGAKEPPAQQQDQDGLPGRQEDQPGHVEGTPAPSGPGQEENHRRRTESEVWQEFEPRLAALQVKYQGELDTLVARAFSDYQRYKNDKPTLLALVPYYLRIGSALEKEADAEFNRIIAALEGELKANYLPINLATDLRRQYRELKQQKRRQLFNRAWELIPSQA